MFAGHYPRCIYGACHERESRNLVGRSSIEHSVEKVRELRALIEQTGSKALIEVDGGVNLETGARLVEAGADALVAGNAVFGAPDPEAMIHRLHEL